MIQHPPEAFVFTRHFDAPITKVWKAWTELSQLENWWGPKGFSLQGCSLSLREGGMFHYGMSLPDGTLMWGKWVLREIAAPERLVSVASFSDAEAGTIRNPWSDSWPLETLSTVGLAPDAKGTSVTLTGVPLNASPHEVETFRGAIPSMQHGWTGTFDQLEAWLARA